MSEDLSQQIATLSPKQRKLLELRLKQKQLQYSESQIIPKREGSDNPPLSFAQQRLWFIQQLDPSNTAYNIPLALRLRGELKIAILYRVFHELFRRHETLRTRFISDDEGNPMQVIESTSVRLPVFDLTQVPQLTSESQDLVRQISQLPFDLSQSSSRLALLRLGETDHVLLLTLHHIIADRWSLGILTREFKALYEAFSKGEPSPLLDLPIQYADWALWQRQWLQRERLEKQLSYWHQQLADMSMLELPTDKSRPTTPTFRGGRYPITLSRPLTAALKQLSAQEGISLFVLLLTTFKILLYKYSNQEDIVIGTDIANRNQIETEGLIGLLVNTLVLRTKLNSSFTFQEVVQKVREVTLEAYAHQDLPFERLVEYLKPERDLSRVNPLFQVKFDFQLASVDELRLSGLNLETFPIESETTKFELRFNLSEVDQAIRGQVEYSLDLFNEITIADLTSHFQNLLASVVTDYKLPISELSLFSEQEQRHILVDWNQTEAEYSEACLHELFEAQVERSPEAVALVFEQQHLTYDELNRRANQLAHYLQGQGVGPETLVGVCLERSVAMVIALLGVLKAGGAYVPLDPSHPQERLAYILEDAQARCLLTQAAHVGVLPTSVSPLCLDTDWDCIAESPSYPPAPVTALEQLSYVIYTSGSTGAPKGVQIPHQALSNFLYSMAEYPGLRAEDRLVSVTTVAFDIAALELYLPLLQGARLEVVSREVACDAHHLARRLEQFDATVLQATPATWQMLMSTEWSGSSALLVFCGGDALPLELAHQLYARSAGVWNLYGPTETTIWSAVSELRAECETVPLGQPIANTQLYVLDKAGQPTPIGVPGELHIGGMGLARGYYQRPELTAERLCPIPLAPHLGPVCTRLGT
ncbi:Non-ribosomal peptide synthetase [Halomicronema hongdechloris C2206]|uniref:Non-ribosomal peptide synthetase n=1 Tax=Halomicronema hongdechloris C2206 TaxID=1641165 RepID=A0A1Z3HL40_9CYAN|nr:amino acid adenylation domain-containing protein [Halomicronema hongdechloris]ASC71032.1 Non-ribosomal peptide synthetase [Halomicronema hongdechloris C2206]